MGGPTFVRFLAVQYFVWPLCWAASFQALDPSSSLYTFGSGWAKNAAGQYTTIAGSVLISFTGSSFSIPGDVNPRVNLILWVDGHFQGAHTDGSVPEVVLSDGEHQIVLEARVSSSNPYIFPGIAFPVQNGTSLNVTEHFPQTYGIDASVVPSDAIILDNTDGCMLYSQGDTSHWDNSDLINDWGSYNESLAVSTTDSSTPYMQIYFQGTGIWLFFSQITTTSATNPASLEVNIYLDPVGPDPSPPEVFDKISLSPFGISDIALRQKMLWSYTNLTDGSYVLRLQVDRWTLLGVADNRVALDFARVKGAARDCRLYNLDYGSVLTRSSWKTMRIVAVVVGGLLSPVLLYICIRCFCYMKTRKFRPHGMLPFGTESPGETGGVEEKFRISEDGSSFMSIMARKHGTGPQALPLSLTGDDAPTPVSRSHTKISPFNSYSLDINHQQRLSGVEPQGKVKHPLNHSRLPDPNNIFGVSGGGWAVTSAGLETNTDTGSDISSLPSSPPRLRQSAVLLGSLDEWTPLGASGDDQHQTDWSPPPPSYITRLHGLAPGPRPGERVRLLTQEDLSRLVDRVVVLRGRETRLAVVGAEGQAEEESHEDPVEILARRIADTDTSSDSICVSTERQKSGA